LSVGAFGIIYCAGSVEFVLCNCTSAEQPAGGVWQHIRLGQVQYHKDDAGGYHTGQDDGIAPLAKIGLLHNGVDAGDALCASMRACGGEGGKGGGGKRGRRGGTGGSKRWRPGGGRMGGGRKREESGW